LVPGLGTGIGDIPPERAAKQMRIAFQSVIRGSGAKSRRSVE
jgi:hypothetical protein